jgi:polar amino acid transport system substrate-binding protein
MIEIATLPTMRSPHRRLTACAVALLMAVAFTACGKSIDDSPVFAPSAVPGVGSECLREQVKTLVAGKLTIATDDPVFPPWFVDNVPDNGQGFEGVVAYLVALRLGFARNQVVWVRVPFNSVLAPGDKAFDFAIDKFSITEDRKSNVDFSSPYYDVPQAVITLKTSKIAGARGIAELKTAKLGAQVATTSYRAILETVKPNRQPVVFTSNKDAKKALVDGQVDGLVVDLPTAFFMTSSEIDNSQIVGQLPQPAGQPEQFGLVFGKGSMLVTCVNKVLDAERTNGMLKGMATQWLSGVSGAPVLS